MTTLALAFSSMIILAAAGAPEPGAEVKGSFEINGAAVPLKFAYMLQHNDEEGFLDGPELRIVVTDREIDPRLLTELVMSDVDSLAKEKKVRGFILRLDPNKTPREIHGTLLEAPESAQASLPFFTHSGDDTCVKKLDIKDGKATVVLEAKPDQDSNFQDIPKFGFSLSFTAPVRQNDPITARLKGAEAVNSPQAKVVLAYEKACRTGDIEAAAKLSTPRRLAELKEAIKQMGKETFIKQASQFIPDPAVRAKQIAEVIVRGKRATVILKEEGSRTPAPVTEVDGVWITD